MDIESELIWEAHTAETEEAYFKRHNIDEDDLGYLGSGDFGEAYVIDDGTHRVLKKTTSESEYEIAKTIKEHPDPYLATVYDVSTVNNEMWILVEELSDEIDIEHLWYTIANYLEQTEDQIPIGEMNYIDIDDVEEELGITIGDDEKKFANELGSVISSAQRYAGMRADVKEDNLGHSFKDGSLKAFDVDISR